MYSDMPALVDSNAGQADASGWSTVNAAPQQDPWASAGRGGNGGVTPGGFGAGAPLPQAGRGQPFGPRAMMAAGQTPSYAFAPPPPFGTPHPAMMGFGAGGGGGPWGTPASAFDQGMGLPPSAGQNAYPQAGLVGGPAWPAFGEAPPAARKRPQNAAWLTPQPTPHRRFEQFEDEDYDGDDGSGGNFDGGQTMYGSSWGGTPAWAPWDVTPGTPGAPGMALRRTRSAGAGSSSSRSTPRLKYSRPGNWRPEFTPRPAGLMRLLSFGKGRGSPKGEIGRERSSSFLSMLSRTGLHWSLDGRKSACQWDIRQHPTTAFFIRSENRILDYIELQESAFTPPTPRVRLVHPFLPWYIYVHAPQGAIITVEYLLDVLYGEMQNPVLHSDFWNDELGEDDRKAIHAAWAARAGGVREIAEQGIKRVDYLCDRVIFEGLKRVGDDWQLRMKPVK